MRQYFTKNEVICHETEVAEGGFLTIRGESEGGGSGFGVVEIAIVYE